MAKIKSSPEEKKAHAEFESAASHWLEQSCEMFPEQASTLGFRQYDPMLGKNTPAVRAQHIELLEQTLARIESLPEALFTGDAWLDRRGLLAHLRMELLFERDLARWRVNPQTHTGAAINSIFDLLVRAGENPAQILPTVESRLGRLPDFLRAGLDGVNLPDPLWVELAKQSCEGAVEFLKGLESELARFSKNPLRLSSLLQTASRAFTEFASALSRKKTAQAGSFAIGRERFEFLIRERLGLDLSLNEARAVGEYQIARHEFLLREAAKRHGRSTARVQIDRAAAAWNPGKPLIEVYREATARIRVGLQNAGVVTLPKGDTLKVLPVPPFLKHQFPTAAYSAPEPFSAERTGIFWVNDLSLDQKTAARRSAEIRQHHGLELTCVHEGYPGHHLQFVVQFNHPSRWRRLFAHAIFYEGWTMWCEKMAVDHHLVDLPGVELIQLHDALWRAHRIVIDCGLHDGSLTPSAAAMKLRRGVGFTAARAKADVNWYTSSPAVPMTYLLGRLEVEKLHARLVTEGGWGLKQFNDWMLSHGALPYSWIVRDLPKTGIAGLRGKGVV